MSRRRRRPVASSRSSGVSTWMTLFTAGLMAVALVMLLRGRDHVADGAGAFFTGVAGSGDGAPAESGEGVAAGGGNEPADESGMVPGTVRLDVDPAALARETARWRIGRALVQARDTLAPPAE